jgi:23S rRNA (cytidine1920-2'-O)/16S rRNA (cytidine1409-2'-O)-methyltransferase
MAPSPKERLDKILVDRGLCTSRAQAQALIMDGKVKVSGQPITKPGTQIALDESDIHIAGLQPYVSRGGFKLEKALLVFDIATTGRVCIDVGASTGGFTDCLLQKNASQVISVDVGHGQLDWKLRNHSQVQVLEKTNIRDLKPESLNYAPSLGVVDTSFISLKKVLPPLASLLTPDAEIIALLKPQFEYRDYIEDNHFKGVVRGQENHQKILEGVLTDLSTLLSNWSLLGLNFSPITGPKGNIEYLLHYARGHYVENRVILDNLSLNIQTVITNSYKTNLDQ